MHGFIKGATALNGDATGTRTRIASVKGWCPDRLDDGTLENAYFLRRDAYARRTHELFFFTVK